MGIGIAPAKTILFGEHAVVYGEPGIAIPLWDIKTTASFRPLQDLNRKQEFHISSPLIGLEADFSEISSDLPLKKLIYLLIDLLHLTELPAKTLQIETTIPIASGLGSGAACSVAVIRAFFDEYQCDFNDAEVSAIAFEIEKYYHGSPSGLDNTTISFGKPVYFQKEMGFEILQLGTKLNLIVADTGIQSVTSVVVQDVKTNYLKNHRYLKEIGQIAKKARPAIEKGNISEIGLLMNENHELLKKIDVSCYELDLAVETARKNGALGAKLTGAGRGGNFIALAENPSDMARIKESLKQIGAKIIL